MNKIHALFQQIITTFLVSLTALALADVPETWTVDPANFDHSMVVVGVAYVDKAELANENDRVAAFVNGQCRGVVKPILEKTSNRYLFYLLVYSNQVSDVVSFKIYQSQTDKVWDAVVNTPFQVDGLRGTTERPFMWSNVAMSNQASLLGIQFWERFENATFQGQNVLAPLVANTNLSALRPQFTLSDGATAWVNGVQQVSGQTLNDFRQPVKYVIRSEDQQVFVEYTVSASIVLSNDDPSFLPTKELFAYPNPANGQIWLQVPHGTKEVFIYHTDGRLIESRVVTANGREAQPIFMNVSNWLSGTYLVKAIHQQAASAIRIQIE